MNALTPSLTLGCQATAIAKANYILLEKYSVECGMWNVVPKSIPYPHVVLLCALVRGWLGFPRNEYGHRQLFALLFNEIIGWGTPLFEQNSHRMVAWREAALKKEEKERTIVTMFVDLTLAQ